MELGPTPLRRRCHPAGRTVDSCSAKVERGWKVEPVTTGISPKVLNPNENFQATLTSFDSFDHFL